MRTGSCIIILCALAGSATQPADDEFAPIAIQPGRADDAYAPAPRRREIAWGVCLAGAHGSGEKAVITGFSHFFLKKIGGRDHICHTVVVYYSGVVLFPCDGAFYDNERAMGKIRSVS